MAFRFKLEEPLEEEIRRTEPVVAALAQSRQLVVFSDEIYDHMLFDDAVHVPMATLVKHTLCATFSGLSKVGLQGGCIRPLRGHRRQALERLPVPVATTLD